jgi:hypothetical protein
MPFLGIVLEIKIKLTLIYKLRNNDLNIYSRTYIIRLTACVFSYVTVSNKLNIYD